ncbi:hypothetical protein AVEN_267550-1 [Araneus ventricosus]|uniref:Uncharacterized protein n=1 Tax=Araneus ventricosus TaxID=182803 RepID=A0A4Y2RKH6_ARAVE|nr:hypothetical protein AVEN_246425-1 [Araneus ventricosus]GBN76196.1 hypothetical protein AVEN_267550-1 [Araneus ventricosus]
MNGNVHTGIEKVRVSQKATCNQFPWHRRSRDTNPSHIYVPVIIAVTIQLGYGAESPQKYLPVIIDFYLFLWRYFVPWAFDECNTRIDFPASKLLNHTT